MVDEAFLTTIRAAPNDAAARLVYADWLEERGDSRGDFLRAEVALFTARTEATERNELQARLRTVCAGIDPNWLAVVSRVPIENCGVSFQFRCPKRWEALQPTKDESIRFCEACRQRVYFCNDLKIAQTHAAVGDCIAVDPRLVRRQGDLESNFWEMDIAMGLPLADDPAESPKDDD